MNRDPDEGDVVTVHLTVGPLERQLGIAELGDVDFDPGVAPQVGGHLQVVDEGGHVHRAIVDSIEPGRYGRRYRIRFVDPAALVAATRRADG